MITLVSPVLTIFFLDTQLKCIHMWADYLQIIHLLTMARLSRQFIKVLEWKMQLYEGCFEHL